MLALFRICKMSVNYINITTIKNITANECV